MNAVLECEADGNANSTRAGGTHMMNGVGGSGDFAHDVRIAIVVARSYREGRRDPDHPAHGHACGPQRARRDFLTTENGPGHLRGLAPRERARPVTSRCAQPGCRDACATMAGGRRGRGTTRRRTCRGEVFS